MKKATGFRLQALALVLLVGALGIVACPPRTASDPSTTRAVLSAEEIACVFASTLTDAKALALACKLAPALTPELLPLLSDLIGQREGARTAGVRWHDTKDAGGDAAR